MFEGTLLFLCLTESSPFLGFSDVSSWLDYASQLECYLSDTVTLSKYHTHVEGPRVHLPLVDDVGFDCPVKGLSDLYAAEFYFSLIDTRSSSIPHVIGTLARYGTSDLHFLCDHGRLEGVVSHFGFHLHKGGGFILIYFLYN